jgi:hypothetical protein
VYKCLQAELIVKKLKRTLFSNQMLKEVFKAEASGVGAVGRALAYTSQDCGFES